MREYHVRFRERFGVKFPLSTRLRWKCQYHVVFIPKYRKKVLYGKLKADVRDIISTLCRYITEDAIKKCIREQAEESRKGDLRSTAL